MLLVFICKGRIWSKIFVKLSLAVACPQHASDFTKENVLRQNKVHDVKGERGEEGRGGGRNRSGNGWCMDVRNVVGHAMTYWITRLSNMGWKMDMSLLLIHPFDLVFLFGATMDCRLFFFLSFYSYNTKMDFHRVKSDCKILYREYGLYTQTHKHTQHGVNYPIGDVGRVNVRVPRHVARAFYFLHLHNQWSVHLFDFVGHWPRRSEHVSHSGHL